MAEWREMSAGDLGRAIGKGAIDPRDLTAAFLDAARAHPMTDRIYARMTEARAMAEAEAAHRRAVSGLRLSPLDGVPISWKDLYDTAGVVTEAGSRLLAGRTPDRDAEVLANATAGGLVCLGKTHMTELAFSGLGINPMTATSPNIHNPAWAPGGSSSGAAASVAFGLAAAGIGSDTGGSVRLPSAWNDLVGLKTTSGRISTAGVVPLVESFDTVGPLCRTVEDAGLLLAALEGGRPADLTGATLSGRRLMVLETLALDECSDEARAGFDSALSRLAAAGARIERGAVPELAEAMELSVNLFTSEAYAIWRDRIEADPDLMFTPVRDRFRTGATFASADYVAAWRRMRAIRAIWADRTAGYDAVVTPTSAILPPDVARLLADAEYFKAQNRLALRNTYIGSLMGLCGLTLPTGIPATGIQFLGAPMAEERLLRLGAAAEAALA